MSSLATLARDDTPERDPICMPSGPVVEVMLTMPHSPFYSTKQWKDTRGKYLALHPYCEICLLIGIRSRAVEVDHIRPIDAGGALLDFRNLSSKCRMHHSQKTMALDMPNKGRDKLVTTGPDGFPIYTEVRHHGKKTA